MKQSEKIKPILKKEQASNPLVLTKRSFVYNTKEFFNNSTLHGVKYIVENAIPSFEKFMWFCFTSIGTVVALIIIMSLWEKFQTNPTITGLDAEFIYKELLFPTVVLCPSLQYDEGKVNETAYSLANSIPNSDPDELSNFIKKLYSLSMDNLEQIYMEAKQSNIHLENININIRKIIMENAIDCENIFDHCKFGDNVIFHCCRKFDPIYSEYGFCYAFNSKYKSEVMNDLKLKPNNTNYETEKNYALVIEKPIINTDIEVFVLWAEDYFDIRYRSLATYYSNDDNCLTISVLDAETITTESTKQLSIKQRKCIFEGEINLKYFSGYTYLTCLKNCKITRAIQFCDCVPPFYCPVENVKICDFKDFPCLIKYNGNITDTSACTCAIRCNDVCYNIEKMEYTNKETQASEIKIEVVNWPILRSKREVLFGWIELLVSFGGIAGLFLGFSLLSAVEIIYYFTMRACCTIYLEKEKLLSIEEEIKNKPTEKINLSLKITKSKKIKNNFSKSENVKNDNLRMKQNKIRYINVNNIKPSITQLSQVKETFYLP